MIVSLYDNEGYLYGSFEDLKDELVYKSLSAYPQGWHLTSSILLRGFDNSIKHSSVFKQHFFYFSNAMLWYFILIFLISTFLIKLSKGFIKKDLSWLLYGSVFFVVLLIEASLLFGVLRYGFVNYIATLAFLIAIFLLVYELSARRMSLSVFLPIASILSAGVTFSWLLAAPVAYITIFIAFIYHFTLNSSNNIRSRKLLLSIVVSLVIFCISITQLFLQLKYSTIPNNINAEGGSWITNNFLTSTMFFAVAGIALYKKTRPAISETIVITFSAASIPVGLIYMYQFYSAAKVSYYSHKVGLILVLLLSIYAGVLLLYAIQKFYDYYGYSLSTFMAFGVIVSAPFIFGINMQEVRFAFNNDRVLSMQTSAQINDLIRRGEGFDNNVIVMKQLNYEEDVITTHFMSTLSREQTDCGSKIIWGQITGDKGGLVNSITGCSKTNPTRTYYVFASTSNYSELLKQFKGVEGVRVILSN